MFDNLIRITTKCKPTEINTYVWHNNMWHAFEKTYTMLLMKVNAKCFVSHYIDKIYEGVIQMNMLKGLNKQVQSSWRTHFCSYNLKSANDYTWHVSEGLLYISSHYELALVGSVVLPLHYFIYISCHDIANTMCTGRGRAE